MVKGDEYVRNMLIEYNFCLVVYIVKKFENIGEDVEDLIFIGIIGLIKGIESYFVGKGIKLVMYVVWCIENEIFMYLCVLKKIKKDVFFYDLIGQDKEGNEISLIDVLKLENEDVIDIIQFNMEFEKVK